MKPRSWPTALAVACATAALAVALRPAVVNGDGLGYLKAAPTGIVVPGHLGYLPLLRALVPGARGLETSIDDATWSAIARQHPEDSVLDAGTLEAIRAKRGAGDGGSVDVALVSG